LSNYCYHEGIVSTTQQSVSGGFTLAHLQCAKLVPGTKYEVYRYFTSPEHLADQLSGLIKVTWQNPGVEIKPGSEFLFLMSRYGVEQPIRFVVDRLVTGNSFAYRQVSGVYARWIHTMKFEEHGPNQTLVTDIVEYEIPFGILGRIADDFFIRHDLKNILEHRMDRAILRFREGSEENPQQAIS
jgi:ligand-binding SRPBCC domain-containing protein